MLKGFPKEKSPNVPENYSRETMPKIPKKSSKLISDQAKRLCVHEKESSPPPVTRKLLPNLAFIEFDNVSHPGMPLPTATSEHATGLNGNQKLAAANSGTTSKQASEAGWQLTDINKQVHKIPSGYCFQFAELGKCRYRMGCKFKHVLLKNIPVVEKADVNPSTSRGGLLPQPVPLLQKKLDTPIGVTEEMKRSIAAISPLLPSPEPHEPLGRHQRDPMETFHPLPQPAIDAIQQCSSESSTLQHKLKRRDEENLRDRAQTEEDSGSPKGKNWQVSEKEKDDINKVQRNQNSVRNEANADEGFTETSSSGIFDKKYRLDCKEALIEMGRCFEIDTTHQTLKILQQLSNFHEQEVESEDDLLSVAVNIFKDCVPRQQTTQEDTYLLSKLSDQLFQESHWALLSVFVYKQLDKGFMPSLSSLENVIFKYHALNNHNEDLMKLMRKVDEINMQLPVHIYDRVKKCLELSPYPEDCLVILQMKGRFHPLDPIEQSLAVSQSSDPNLQPSLLSVDDNLPEDCNDGGPLSQRNDPPSFYNGTRKAISVTIQKAKDIETLAKIFLTIYERDRIYLSEEPIQTCLSFGIIRISPSKPHLVYRDFVAYIQGDQALDHDGVIYLVSVGREIFMDRWRRKQIDVCCHILETLSQMDYDVILTVFVNLSTEKMCGRSPFNSLSCLVECCLRTKTTYMAYKLLLALQNNEWDHTFWDKTTKALAWQQHYEELANQLIMAGHLEECLQLLVRMGKSKYAAAAG
ncbi:hypothetical protein BSL78_26661 [Apostichopus japonicus]|uniref:C3H1-type domain-containing protein n=1 Tax=Stichopus japonicus TaxID=307972 RepID=A0A2G8JL79_STIJA|nr:hypothetical protein BSL78_26661 [Apostichopus japonicus]